LGLFPANHCLNQPLIPSRDKRFRQDKIICGSTMKREMEQMANSGEWAAKLASLVNRDSDKISQMDSWVLTLIDNK
jgi:hypothetical protein